MEQRPGEGQALALAAGEVLSSFGEPGVQPRFASEKVCQIHLIEGLPELVVPGIGPAHEEVVPHGALEQIALVADIGDVLHQAVL